jgi:uncharacterized membrane protein
LLVACERTPTPFEPVVTRLDNPSADRAAPELSTLGLGQSFSFDSIKVPGATSTTAWGINARGAIVGTYVDGSGRSHGFLLRRDEYTTIDKPDAAYTEARGIGPNGDIVGMYRLPDEPAVNAHGYRRSPNGKIVLEDFPGHTNTIAQRILPDGTILGCRHDYDQMVTMRGIVMSKQGDDELDAFSSMNNGATPDRRRIVGWYINMDVTPNRQEGYVVDDGVFTPLLVPGSNLTAAWDVNPAGDIVGAYRDASGVHGYVLTTDGYVPLNFPGATATRAFGINARGDIVGAYVAGGRTIGFVARRAAN